MVVIILIKYKIFLLTNIADCAVLYKKIDKVAVEDKWGKDSVKLRGKEVKGGKVESRCLVKKSNKKTGKRIL